MARAVRNSMRLDDLSQVWSEVIHGEEIQSKGDS